MQIIKLNAIGSTNDFLRELHAATPSTGPVLVTADVQTHGKGQRGATWQSEPGKNVIMSLLVQNAVANVRKLFDLNRVVSLSVLHVLRRLDIPELSVKWPNDIMSGRFKIGGILIENTVRNSGSIVSIIGLGLNVNQLDFPRMAQASSLKLQTGREFDTASIIAQMAAEMLDRLPVADSQTLHRDYTARLFRIGVPTAFEDASNERFMGMVAGVTQAGKLIVDRDNAGLREYDLKEIRMLY